MAHSVAYKRTSLSARVQMTDNSMPCNCFMVEQKRNIRPPSIRFRHRRGFFLPMTKSTPIHCCLSLGSRVT